MRALALLLLPMLALLPGCAEATAAEAQTLEAGCASCIYSMEGAEGCALAVKVDDSSYLVSGVEFETHGSGLCKATGEVAIEGEVVGDAFVATKVDLLD